MQDRGLAGGRSHTNRCSPTDRSGATGVRPPLRRAGRGRGLTSSSLEVLPSATCPPHSTCRSPSSSGAPARGAGATRSPAGSPARPVAVPTSSSTSSTWPRSTSQPRSRCTTAPRSRPTPSASTGPTPSSSSPPSTTTRTRPRSSRPSTCSTRRGAASRWRSSAYGGLSGGLRAVEHLRQVFAELHATTIRETVSLHRHPLLFDDDGDARRPDRAGGGGQGDARRPRVVGRGAAHRPRRGRGGRDLVRVTDARRAVGRSAPGGGAG